ncbi:hypothetical protein Q0590_20420 [Rhodocytophaga aerolata]|uniref:Glycosyltransferase n=1 Tax=Rhodocytophaga aerolata TaxID=455078 RepID=A0ABT8R984_9BACT|nr:hypothetical protein [Rhodocytophaga aerolata]MDO1448653.1 hypothetical protein [Rhodocytophaga aerolata]
MHTNPKNQLAIATISWARTEAEEKLLQASLQQLAECQVPVYITDGGSSPGFLDFLHSIPQFIVLQAEAKGVWAQARTSLLAAYEAGSAYLFYTEPDKLDFFRHGLPPIFSQLPNTDTVGIRLASRSAEAFASFPPFQQLTETTINACCAEVTGKAFEYTYGPFLINRNLVPYLKFVEEDIGWGWRPYMFGITQRVGYKLESMEGNFTCPPDQQADDPAERVYRMRQLQQNIQGIVLSTQVKLK